MTIMSTFALLALVLCATGIYGILSFTTSQRTREIGVRMALGADGRAIQRMVLREGSIVILIGIIAGRRAHWPARVSCRPYCSKSAPAIR
jgi:ABC-type antimicrobial peptide transport system permease subunit